MAGRTPKAKAPAVTLEGSALVREGEAVLSAEAVAKVGQPALMATNSGTAPLSLGQPVTFNDGLATHPAEVAKLSPVRILVLARIPGGTPTPRGTLLCDVTEGPQPGQFTRV